MALNIRIDRTAGTFDVVSEDRVYVRDGGVAVKVYGFEESELSGNATLAPCVQFVGRNGVMAQAELSLDSGNAEDETVAKGTLSTNTEQMASLFAGCVAETCRTVTVRVFATKVQKPIALGTVEVWNFPNGGTVPDNLITGAQLQTRIDAALAAAASAEDDADDAEGYAKAAQEYANGKYVDGVLSVDGANQFKEQAAESASSAQSSAAQANEYANGKTVNGVVTKGAKQYAADAAKSATDLAQAVEDAQEAQGKAETAQGKAEAAQGKAEKAAGDAETVLASAATKTELQAHADNAQVHLTTTAQRSAVNSGITSALVGEIPTADQKSAWSAKQDALPLQRDGKTYDIGVQAAAYSVCASSSYKATSDSSNNNIVSTYSTKSELSSHTGNGDIHVTAEQKSAWSAKQDAIAAFLKDAVVNGGVLTITKKDGTTVQFQGGSSAWADITGKPQSFTPSAHTHTKSQITDFGGPYLPISGGGTVSGYTAETGEPIGAEIVLDNESGGGGKVEIATGTQGEGGSISVKDGGVPGGASIKKNGKEVATEDQLPYASTSTPADRTCATVTVASTGASVTIPKPSTANKVTAFCVYLDMTALTGTAPTVGYKYSDNTDPVMLTRGGETLSYETGAINAVFFIQVGTGYIVSAQTYKEPSNG